MTTIWASKVIPPSPFTTDFTAQFHLEMPAYPNIPPQPKILWESISSAMDYYFYPELEVYLHSVSGTMEKEYARNWFLHMIPENFAELNSRVCSGSFDPHSPGRKHNYVTYCGSAVIRYFEFYQFCLFYSDVVDCLECTPAEQQMVYQELEKLKNRFNIRSRVPRYLPPSRSKYYEEKRKKNSNTN